MLFKIDHSYKIGQKVCVIRYNIKENKDEIVFGTIIAKRKRYERLPVDWVYLIKLENNRVEAYNEMEVWTAVDKRGIK